MVEEANSGPLCAYEGSKYDHSKLLIVCADAVLLIKSLYLLYLNTSQKCNIWRKS
jgi:hypothetical protein